MSEAFNFAANSCNCHIVFMVCNVMLNTSVGFAFVSRGIDKAITIPKTSEYDKSNE